MELEDAEGDKNAATTRASNAVATIQANEEQIAELVAGSDTAAADQEALQAELEAEQSARATAEADLAAAEASIADLSIQATAQASAAGAALDPNFVDISVQVDDPGGVFNGDQAAIGQASAAFTEALQPYVDAGCRAGVVLTFGHAPDIVQGTQLAGAVNAVLPEAAPDLFDGSAFDNFGNLNQPYGQIDLRIYFFTGCDPAE